MFQGDSLEYEVFEKAIQRLQNPLGATVEIGVRRGLGSKLIIDNFRKYFPKLKKHYHLGIDPYGNIAYNPTEQHKNVRLDYTNTMKREALMDFAKYYPEFHMVCLEDTEFFKRYADGYPVYDEYKTMLTRYDLVHFDGPHDLLSVFNEVSFFNSRRAEQCIFVFDDILSYDHGSVDNVLKNLGYHLIFSGKRKAVYTKEGS